MPSERHDPFYFSRSDLSDEEKMRILNEKLDLSLEQSARGEVYSIEEVTKHLDNVLAKFVKRAS